MRTLRLFLYFAAGLLLGGLVTLAHAETVEATPVDEFLPGYRRPNYDNSSPWVGVLPNIPPKSAEIKK